jgi:hypothetical protein
MFGYRLVSGGRLHELVTMKIQFVLRPWNCPTVNCSAFELVIYWAAWAEDDILFGNKTSWNRSRISVLSNFTVAMVRSRCEFPVWRILSTRCEGDREYFRFVSPSEGWRYRMRSGIGYRPRLNPISRLYGSIFDLLCWKIGFLPCLTNQPPSKVLKILHFFAISLTLYTT